MSSIPYSRYLIYPVTWYSFLIVAGAVLAVFIASREERRASLPKDTVVDLALWILPCGIVGARLYYIVFSWPQFSGDPLSVLRIWEGGLAIYGGIIAGFASLLLFSRRRHLSSLLLCDLIAPGLALAQSIGRWGNWFNIEAYGFSVRDPALCFFPFAVQVPSDGGTWHLASFFFESAWDFCVFLFLMLSRRRMLRRKGDVFFFYAFLYAAGRLVIEETRMDSLYAGGTVRISQLLSVLVCASVLVYYLAVAVRRRTFSHFFRWIAAAAAAAAFIWILCYALTGTLLFLPASFPVIGMLSACSLLMMLCLFAVFPPYVRKEE